MAAHEAATKISKSDILQHADAVGKPFNIECGQIYDLHNVSSANSLLARLHPIVLDNAPMFTGISIVDSRPLLGNDTGCMIEIPPILIVS